MSREQERQINKVLLLHESREAGDKVVRSCQCEAFMNDYKALVSAKPTWPKSPLFKLNAVFNEDGGICSNGRLQFAEYLPYGVRFPKILLRGHWVTKLIIKHYYEQANHSAGTKFLLQHVQTKEEQVINTNHDSICFPRST